MTDALGVVIPAHDEEDRLDSCLRALVVAASDPGIGIIPVRVAVVLDACTDRSAAVVAAWQARFAHLGGSRSLHALEISATNVGMARAAGSRWLLDAFAGIDPARIWLASTDADSAVPPHWLTYQMGLHQRGFEAWLGTVEVDDWSQQSAAAARWFASTYRPRPGHRHVHGTNLGFSAAAYLRSGGFPPLASSEDVALCAALHETGAVTYAGPDAPVVTSARRDWRAAGGFGETLHAITGADAANAEAAVSRHPTTLTKPTKPAYRLTRVGREGRREQADVGLGPAARNCE